jgi:hypothetical protein
MILRAIPARISIGKKGNRFADWVGGGGIVGWEAWGWSLELHFGVGEWHSV